VIEAQANASVAQLAEQLTLNQLVEGSSPSRGTTSFLVYPFVLFSLPVRLLFRPAAE
jgi:hypothetical protein